MAYWRSELQTLNLCDKYTTNWSVFSVCLPLSVCVCFGRQGKQVEAFEWLMNKLSWFQYENNLAVFSLPFLFFWDRVSWDTWEDLRQVSLSLAEDKDGPKVLMLRLLPQMCLDRVPILVRSRELTLRPWYARLLVLYPWSYIVSSQKIFFCVVFNVSNTVNTSFFKSFLILFLNKIFLCSWVLSCMDIWAPHMCLVYRIPCSWSPQQLWTTWCGYWERNLGPLLIQSLSPEGICCSFLSSFWDLKHMLEFIHTLRFKNWDLSEVTEQLGLCHHE